MRRDAEVQSGATVLFRTAPRENRRDVGLVWRFVLAETSVAVDAVNGFGGLHQVIGRETHHLGVERRHQLRHRRFHLLFVDVLAGLKPLAAVIASHAAEKLHARLGEALEADPRSAYWLSGHTQRNPPL